PAGTPVAAAQASSSTGANVVEFVAFSPGGTILASGADDGTVRLWNIANPAKPRPLAQIQDAHTFVFSVAFSPSGRVLAAASADGKARLWAIANPAAPVPPRSARTSATNTAYSVAFSPEGHR